MMILNWIATICFVIGLKIDDNSHLWGVILMTISSMCFSFSFLRYEDLKERIKTLEQKGGGSDA
jgi:multidrug transporter EmrE-like cation transporter